MKNRILLGGLAALAIMAFGAASASATTINNKGPFAPLANSATLNIINSANHLANLTVTCSTSIMPGTVNADSSITGGTPTFSGCTSKLGSGSASPAEVTALEPVHYSMLLGAGGVTTNLSKINLNLHLNQYNCGMTIAGSSATSTPGTAPVTVSKLSLSSVWRRTAFKGPSRFCEELYINFNEVQFSATYNFSPPLVFTN